MCQPTRECGDALQSPERSKAGDSEKCALASAPPPAPRRRAIAALCLVSASHSFSLSAFFAFAGFLAVDLHWAADLDRAGAVVGVLGAVLPASRIPVSLLWGLAMDRFGRRPCLVLTSCCLMVGSVLFPLMTSWWAALLVRFVILGMGNGWVILMAPCCAELGGPTHQAALLGYVIGAGGFINLVGPGIGGYTYHLFNSPFPALAPCLFGALLSAAAAVACWTCFPETRPPRDQTDTSAQPASQSIGSTASPPHAVAASTAGAEITLHVALRTYPLPLLVCLRCVLGALGFCMMTLIPLWAIASTAAGGLALDHEQLGLMLSLSAALALVYSTLLMAKVIARIGVRRAIISAGLVQSCCVLILPRLQSAPFALVVLVNCVLQVANTTCFTSTIAAVNNVCCQYPNKRGAINGVTVTVESCAKSFGPSLGGSLFSWAIANGTPDGWPKASVVYFSALSTIYLLFVLGATRLPRSIDRAAAPTSKSRTRDAAIEPSVDSSIELQQQAENKPKRGPRVVRWAPLGRAGMGNRSFRRLDE